jgi:hypothetical protein
MAEAALWGLAVLCAALALGGSPARADTFASISPSLAPNRLHAHAVLTFTIHFEGGPSEVPSPVRRAILRLPAGLSLDIPQLRSCDPVRLQVRGAKGCPARSAIGGGYALVEGSLGAQVVTEDVSLQAFLGPLHNLEPTFEILSQGFRPVGAQFVFTAMALPDRAPYGEELVVSIPPIPTVPGEPDASVLTFALKIGYHGRHVGAHAASVLVPTSCPSSGLPFAAEFTYADGSSGRALTSSPCPK